VAAMPHDTATTTTQTGVAPTLAGSFHLPTRVRFGRGSRAALTQTLGAERCLVLTSRGGRRRVEADPALSRVLGERDALWLDRIGANPTVGALDRLIGELRSTGWQGGTIVAIGGGSVLDAAKAIAAGLAAGGVGVADLARSPAALDERDVTPIVALPTTAGSGSEATPMAVVWHRTPGGGPGGGEGPAKVTLAHPRLYPVHAIVDAELTDTLTPHQTLATGLDAFNQAAESLWNRNANVLTLPLAMRAMALAWRALPALQRDPADRAARDAMAEAGLLAGAALAQTRTVACHALSYPLTDRYGVTHGIACAFTMAPVVRLMLDADDGRFEALAAVLLGPGAGAGALPDAFVSFLGRLGVGEQVREAVGSLEALLALVPEVELPERGGNGLRDIDLGARTRIFETAWGDGSGA
jgi:alcohol dehydrogenase